MPPSITLKAYCDAVIFTGDTFVEGHALLRRGTGIVDIVSNNKVPGEAEKYSYPGQILASGFIDVQVNGGGGVQYNNSPTPDACLHIAKAHRSLGTTHLVPTCITDEPSVARLAIEASRVARESDPSVLGVHLEGPHLSLDHRGVHQKELIRPIDETDLSLYLPVGDEVMIVTVAPESVSSAEIKRLHEQGVIVSIGHTNASLEKIQKSLEAGATGFTHLFNGMGTMSAREPGPAGCALDDRLSWCSVIADGFHVAPEMIRLAIRAKPTGKLFLVSDAMAPSGETHPQPFTLYGETVTVRDGRCLNREGKLAGSCLTLLDAVRYCVNKVGIELDEALRMASVYPSAFLGTQKKLGKLLPGFHSGVLALSPSLATCETLY